MNFRRFLSNRKPASPTRWHLGETRFRRRTSRRRRPLAAQIRIWFLFRFCKRNYDSELAHSLPRVQLKVSPGASFIRYFHADDWVRRLAQEAGTQSPVAVRKPPGYPRAPLATTRRARCTARQTRETSPLHLINKSDISNYYSERRQCLNYNEFTTSRYE